MSQTDLNLSLLIGDKTESNTANNGKAKGNTSPDFLMARENLLAIFNHSNATPIQAQHSNNFFCSYCSFRHPKPSELKKHVLQSHDRSIPFKRKIAIKDLIVKLDITGLNCTVCEQSVVNLEDIINHIKTKHNVKVHDIKNPFLPFKFDDKKLSCYICSAEFTNFMMLTGHLKVHYQNFICEVCGMGFVSRGQVLSHRQSHDIGTFNCSKCTKTFDTERKKKSHEKSHESKLRRKCFQCGERFSTQIAKAKHLVEKHGAPELTVKCQYCDKVFGYYENMMVHIKRVHLMTRNHECPHCAMPFFTKEALKTHIQTHTGEKIYTCDICKNMYKTKTILKEHLKIHFNIKRFKCKQCDMSFVQKSGLKGHVSSKHGSIYEDDA